jgi:hypothetical protein
MLGSRSMPTELLVTWEFQHPMVKLSSNERTVLLGFYRIFWLPQSRSLYIQHNVDTFVITIWRFSGVNTAHDNPKAVLANSNTQRLTIKLTYTWTGMHSPRKQLTVHYKLQCRTILALSQAWQTINYIGLLFLFVLAFFSVQTQF